MSPILILLFGIAPATAVGTDLFFAAITKAVGGTIHHRHDNADWGVARLLWMGSIPATMLTLWWLWSHHAARGERGRDRHRAGRGAGALRAVDAVPGHDREEGGERRGGARRGLCADPAGADGRVGGAAGHAHHAHVGGGGRWG
ncbi:TSUP family transporter [Sphingomonas sp. MMS24-JH45]